MTKAPTFFLRSSSSPHWQKRKTQPGRCSKSYKSATTTSKNNLPTHMRTNKSTDKRIWEESDEPTKTPHEGVKGTFALGDELWEHPLSPWDEQQAKLTRAKVDAPHPTRESLSWIRMTRTAWQDARRSGKEDAGHSLFVGGCPFGFYGEHNRKINKLERGLVVTWREGVL